MDGESFALLLLAGAKWISHVGLVGVQGHHGRGGPAKLRWLLPNASDAAGALESVIERRLVVWLAGCSAVILRRRRNRGAALRADLVGLRARRAGHAGARAGRRHRQPLGRPLATAGRFRLPGDGGRRRFRVAAARRLVDCRPGRRRRLDYAADDRARHEPRVSPAVGSRRSLTESVQVRGSARWRCWWRSCRGLASQNRRRDTGASAVLAGRVLAHGRWPRSGWSPCSRASCHVGCPLPRAPSRISGRPDYGRVLLLQGRALPGHGRRGRVQLADAAPAARRTSPGTRALLRSARLELALAAGVLLVTAVLVHLAMPAEMG